MTCDVYARKNFNANVVLSGGTNMFVKFQGTGRMNWRRQLHRPEEISSSVFATKWRCPSGSDDLSGNGLWSSPGDVGLSLSKWFCGAADDVSPFTFSLLLFLVSVSATFKHDEVCHVDEVLKVMDDEQRARTKNDRPPNLGGMSLAEVGLALKIASPCPEERASSVGGKLRFAAQRPRTGGDVERHSPLSALVLPHSGWNIALVGGRKGSTWTGRRGGCGTWRVRPRSRLGSMDILGHLGFELRVFRPAQRTRRAPWNLLEFRDGHEAVRAAIISGSLLVRQHTFSRRRLRSTGRSASYFSWRVTYKGNCRIPPTFNLIKISSRWNSRRWSWIWSTTLLSWKNLLNHKVQRTSEWHWFRHLRYYVKTNCAPYHKPAFVRMLECEQSYSFEYQGNVGAHTPDRQVLLDPHAWHAPGPRRKPLRSCWHGKTESVKALGACLGRQVLVFNCDEGIDFQAMGRIFIGLVRCGAEVNRLFEEQMSAISKSVQLIQAAIKTYAKVVSLLGREIIVNHIAGICITMNPATKITVGDRSCRTIWSSYSCLWRWAYPTTSWSRRWWCLPRVSRVQRSWLSALWRCSCCRGSCFLCTNTTSGDSVRWNPSCLSQVDCCRTTSAITMNRPTMWKRRSCWSKQWEWTRCRNCCSPTPGVSKICASTFSQALQ